ncbi:MAG: hypothetical protein EXX96DRAFT_604046 [Benjaminiella poitrasii]|nr:MAG: hypothetical protein EXX96DRAFT_604046 [Benjaminiella poitrasii]
MADESNSNEDKSQSDQFNNDQPQQNVNNKMPFRNPMMGSFDPSLMKMGMMNPIQYQHFQQMMFMQQFQRQQQMQRQMNSAAAMSSASPTTSSTIPPETQKPPTGYVCFKCGQPGHWIYYCPNVPKGQFVQRVGMNNRNSNNNMGNQTIMINDSQQRQQQQEEEEGSQKPQELTCMICDKIMTDAVLVPCCGKSFCKECITSTLEKMNHCPFCNQENVSIEQLVPNKTLRLAIQHHIEEKAKKEEKEPEMSKAEELEAEAIDNQEEPKIKEEQAKTEDPAQESSKSSSMPVKSFDSPAEERKIHPRKHMLGGGMPFNNMGQPDNNLMMNGAPNADMFNGMPAEMNWMNMMRPPFMNPRFPGFGAPDINWMRNNGGNMSNNAENDMDMDMPPSRPPYMNSGFPGTFNPNSSSDELWKNNMPPFPGMAPQDMFGFNGSLPFGANNRGGFNMMRGGGRGRGRGYYHNQGVRRRSDYNTGHSTNSSNTYQNEDSSEDTKKDSSKLLSTESSHASSGGNSRSERDRYDRHRRHSRSPSRHDERSSSRHHDEERHRSRDKDYRSSSRKREDRYSSSSNSKRHRYEDEDDDSSKRRERSSRKRSRSPRDDRSSSRHRHRSSSRSHHSSSRHHSSKYRSREREKTRDKSRDRSERSKSDRSERRRHERH